MSPGDSTVLFRALPERISLQPSERRLLRDFARKLSEELANGRPFACLITSDRELLRLNNHFLKHDYATDVLSFPSADEDTTLGDIAISAERAKSQANEFGHSQADELRILMLHGVLHLCGMDHETDHGEMARAELKWREALQLPATLIERTSPSARRTRRSQF